MTNITLMKLTPAGQRLTARDWHVILTNATQATTPDMLWMQPRPNTIIVQAKASLDATYMRGLIEGITTTATPSIANNDEVVLFGVVNLVKTLATPTGRGTRVPRPDDEKHDYLLEKLGQVLDITELTINPLPPLRFNKGVHRVTINRDEIHATGTVTNNLETLLTGGIGSGKAYGCGLLTVRKATR